MTRGSGRCLCGAVTFTVTHINNRVTACHCSMCRRWGGGPFLAVSGGTTVVFEGEEYITVYNSSEWAERGFCRKCGSHLFYRLKAISEHQMPAGLFNDQGSFNFHLQVFIDGKPAFYSFANKTTEMTEAQVMQQFAPEQSP